MFTADAQAPFQRAISHRGCTNSTYTAVTPQQTWQDYPGDAAKTRPPLYCSQAVCISFASGHFQTCRYRHPYLLIHTSSRASWAGRTQHEAHINEYLFDTWIYTHTQTHTHTHTTCTNIQPHRVAEMCYMQRMTPWSQQHGDRLFELLVHSMHSSHGIPHSFLTHSPDRRSMMGLRVTPYA
jgi:hypothetical protein